MSNSKILSYSTKRLKLIASTLEHLAAELESPFKLSELLNAKVTSEWPPGEYDREATEYFYGQFLEKGTDLIGWLGWYAIQPALEGEIDILIAAGGFFGPPSETGEVEIGYSVIPSFQGNGFATEIVKALVEIAWNDTRVKRIIAHTNNSNEASKNVLNKAGFNKISPADDEEIILFVYDRVV